MFYTVYKVKNLINNKFYIGKHQTKNLDDGYLGSGQLLKRAIKKYGKENFHKEILEVYDQEWKMNLRERILVVPDKEISYNLCPGGHGGWGFLNDGSETHLKRTKKAAKISIQNGSLDKANSRLRELYKDTEWKNNLYKKVSNSLIGNKNWLGRKHSEESKRKISEARKKRNMFL